MKKSKLSVIKKKNDGANRRHKHGPRIKQEYEETEDGIKEIRKKTVEGKNIWFALHCGKEETAVFVNERRIKEKVRKEGRQWRALGVKYGNREEAERALCENAFDRLVAEYRRGKKNLAQGQWRNLKNGKKNRAGEDFLVLKEERELGVVMGLTLSVNGKHVKGPLVIGEKGIKKAERAYLDWRMFEGAGLT